MLRAPLMLYMTAEPFEYPRSDWPPSVRMVGPGIWDPPAKSPAWLEELERPLVLVTCSTEFQNDGKLVQAALEAFAGEDVSVVVTTGGVDPSSFTPPPNAHVERFVPHRPVLERAACVVSHGGMGITQKAFAAGVPVCVVPFGRDQFDVARHVEVADAGTRLPASRLRPDRLRKRCGRRWARGPGRSASPRPLPQPVVQERRSMRWRNCYETAFPTPLGGSRSRHGKRLMSTGKEELMNED